MMVSIKQRHGETIKTVPLVSVILIAYNEENYIREALDSVLRQKTNFKFEIICHDDASQDSTPSIIMEYRERYPDIIVPILQKENKVGKGIENIVISYIYPITKGKYIAYIDGDDYWTDDYKLQDQVDFLENHPEYTCCFHNFDFIFEDTGKRKKANCGEMKRDFTTEEFILWDPSKVPQIGTACFRKDLAYSRPKLFWMVGGGANSTRPISDMPLYVYLSLNGKIHYDPKTRSVWRRRIRGTWGDGASIENATNFEKDEIRFYHELDIYTEHEYHASIQCMINKVQFDIYYINYEYVLAKKLIKNTNISAKHKVVVYIGSFFPNIVKIMIEKRRMYNKKRKLRLEKAIRDGQ